MQSFTIIGVKSVSFRLYPDDRPAGDASVLVTRLPHVQGRRTRHGPTAPAGHEYRGVGHPAGRTSSAQRHLRRQQRLHVGRAEISRLSKLRQRVAEPARQPYGGLGKFVWLLVIARKVLLL